MALIFRRENAAANHRQPTPPERPMTKAIKSPASGNFDNRAVNANNLERHDRGMFIGFQWHNLADERKCRESRSANAASGGNAAAQKMKL